MTTRTVDRVEPRAIDQIERQYTNLAGARNHARVEGYATPAANKHDALAAAPLAITMKVVLDALREEAET